MKIAIDLRSLSSGSISGVENYTVGLLDSLLAADKKNEYILFYNSFAKNVKDEFRFINSKAINKHWPNKVLNAALKLKLVTLEKFTGKIDWLFLPNLNQFNTSSKTKVAITVHDLSPVITPEFYDLRRRIWHKLLNYKQAFLRANLIFAVSEYTKTDLMRLFNVPENKIVVVYPGINNKPGSSDLELKKIRNDLGLPGNYILFLSTVEPRKNLDNLIKAFEQIHLGIHLVIVGKKGWKYKAIFNQIKKSVKSDKIKYIGYVSEQEKSQIIKLAQTVVYPSFYEGFGFVPLEAMGLGVPVVASSVTSIPEVVQDAALLINPYSSAEITKALESILENQILRASLIEKGKKRSQEFDWKKSAEKIIFSISNSNL